MGHLQKGARQSPGTSPGKAQPLEPCSSLGTPGGRAQLSVNPPSLPQDSCMEQQTLGLHRGLGAGRLGPMGVYP